MHTAQNFPCFAFDDPNGFTYGFPAIDARGVKIAEHTGGKPVHNPLQIDRTIDPAEQQRVEQVLADYLPGKVRKRTSHEVCLYTMSRDSHFLVGPHPDHPRVAIAAGFSGHGFKFASVMGEILADLATGNASAPHTSHAIGFLSPQRFVNL
jgi:glycine/D-amino acid oxidase-like deaminating enzyme